MSHPDPRYRKGAVSPELLKQLAASKKNKKKEWHWSLTVTILGLIFGGLVMFLLMRVTLLPYIYLFAGVLVIGLISFAVQWKYFFSPAFIQKHFRLNIGVYALYNICGIGVSTAAVLLFVNWIGASGAENIERHRIIGFDRDYVLDSNFGAVLLLENDAYSGSPGMRSMPYLEAIQKQYKPFLDVVSHKGLLGIPVFVELRMSADPNQAPAPAAAEPAAETEMPADTAAVAADSIQ